MNKKEIAVQILDLVGGDTNVNSVTNCATRLRFSLKDDSKANLEALSKVERVITAQKSGGQTQVVIGTTVNEIFDEMSKLIDVDKLLVETEEEKDTNPILKFTALIASIFTPILPALIGSGMIKAVSTILKTFKIVEATSNFVVIMDMVGDAVFYFLPVLLAVSAAKRFKTNNYMAVLLAGIMLHPTWLGLIAAAEGAKSYSVFGLPFYFQKYSSTVIPIILAVFVLKYVYSFFEKVVPNVVKTIVVPLLTLFVMVPLVFVVIGPFGAYVGTYIADGIKVLFNFNSVIAGFLLGFFRPILVMFGMHYSIMPIQIQQVASSGSTELLASAFTANLAQAGAVLAVVLYVEKSERSAAATAGLTAFFGITEPAIYGYNLKLKVPFFAACLASGVTASILALFNVVATSVTLPNILSVGILSGDMSLSVITALVLLSGVLGFVFTVIGMKFFNKK